MGLLRKTENRENDKNLESAIAGRYERQFGEDYVLLKDMKIPKPRAIAKAWSMFLITSNMSHDPLKLFMSYDFE